jgi:hypothetical protein
MNGKGSKYRPVDKKVYNSNFDDINWGNKPNTKNINKRIRKENADTDIILPICQHCGRVYCHCEVV